MKVKLDDVIMGLEMTNMLTSYYYNPENGEVFPSNIGDILDLSEDELEELIESSYSLPSQYEIDEYQMMEDFIETIENVRVYNQLQRAISGKGAFRRFKDTCFNLDIIDDWYVFRDEKYKNLAIEWCQDNKIEIDN